MLQWNGTAWACANLKGNGTITGVAAGTALTGGGTSGNVTLNLDTTKVPLLSAANTFVGNQAVTGNPTATGSISAQTASLNESGTTNALTINQTGGGAGLTVSAPISLAGILSDSANIGVWGIASSVGGSGVEGETANGNGVYGVDTATSGTVGGPAWRDLQFRWLRLLTEFRWKSRSHPRNRDAISTRNSTEHRLSKASATRPRPLLRQRQQIPETARQNLRKHAEELARLVEGRARAILAHRGDGAG